MVKGAPLLNFDIVDFEITLMHKLYFGDILVLNNGLWSLVFYFLFLNFIHWISINWIYNSVIKNLLWNICDHTFNVLHLCSVNCTPRINFWLLQWSDFLFLVVWRRHCKVVDEKMLVWSRGSDRMSSEQVETLRLVSYKYD